MMRGFPGSFLVPSPLPCAHGTWQVPCASVLSMLARWCRTLDAVQNAALRCKLKVPPWPSTQAQRLEEAESKGSEAAAEREALQAEKHRLVAQVGAGWEGSLAGLVAPALVAAAPPLCTLPAASSCLCCSITLRCCLLTALCFLPTCLLACVRVSPPGGSVQETAGGDEEGHGRRVRGRCAPDPRGPRRRAGQGFGAGTAGCLCCCIACPALL